ncbi:MAG: AAA family ATPase, partial [Pseudomonadota bacterium]
LEEMGAICVIHGENNIGKSNVLEAMQLFFQLLKVQYQHNLVLSTEMSFSEIKQLGIIADEIFNLENPGAIELNAIFEIEANELKNAGIEELLPTSIVQINQRLKPIYGTFDYQLTQFKFADGTDVTDANNEQQSYAKQIAKFLAQSILPLKAENADNRFILIGTDRHISEKEREAKRGMMSQSLCLQLYDAKESREIVYRNRWKLIVRTLQKFNDILGDGEFSVLFDRKTGHAELGFESPSSVLTPIEMLGSGIQQAVALIARLLMSRATFVAIEEPELNLRYTLQLRLREVLYEIVKSNVGPQQIFLTSHSPAFEYGEHFYAMRTTSNGPIIERRSTQGAESFTQHYAITSLPTADKRKAALCYVSNEGLVQLPERIRQLLGIEQGGGIMLLDDENGQVELLSDEKFYDLVEPIDEQK